MQAQYLRESVLPAIQAKIAEENAAFEVEYRKRLAPIMRRIDQTEQVETTQARKVTSNAKTLASVDEKIHIRFQNLRASLPDQIRDVMKNECTLKMLTNPQKIAEVKPILEDLSRLVEQKIDRLSGDPLEGKNQQLSSSPTGTDNEGSLLKM